MSLEEDSLICGFGTSKKEALIVVVPSSTNTNSPELAQIEQEIKTLENSEEFKTLASKNRVWANPKPTEQEVGEWKLLKEKLAYLREKEDFHQKAILSTNAHSVKKYDKTRKGYKADTAIKDERLLLSSISRKIWEKLPFNCEFDNSPTFGDLKRAAKFRYNRDVHDYFTKRANRQVQEEEIKESLTAEEWIWLIGLNQRVNLLLHDSLIANQDGILRLVLEPEVYKDGVDLSKNLILKWYGPEKKVDIKDAASDSSTSP